MLETRGREKAELPLGDRRLLTVADPILTEDGALAGAVYILIDVTEARRLDEQLRQRQKMEAMGQLAGGVAHDFNNLLTAITGNLSLLLAGTPEQDPDRELLLAAERAAWRAAELTRQLLGFSRKAPPQLTPTHLQTCLEEVVGIVRRTFDPRIAVEVRVAPALWTVQANPGQINQVVMNLCLNARDAMPEGGRLSLEAANAAVDEEQARAHAGARRGEYVRLRVRDTGRGIAADVLPYIFEPFFTTKGVGKGTGLGLAVVFGIVQQHQGWIECTSVVGSGACFDIYLPRSGGAPATAAVVAAPPAPLGSETVLLADDDAALRSLGRVILSRYGYEVLLAEDGQQAVDVYRREKDRIALVILDLTMPRLSGRDALRRLLEINPQVRVLLASGYSTEQGAEAGAEGVLGFVTKPYGERDLAAAVRGALDAGRPQAAPAGPSPSAVPPREAPAQAATGDLEAAGRGPKWFSRSRLPKAEAEQLLDWLEANGYRDRDLGYEEGKGFVVRWREGGAPSERERLPYLHPCPGCGSTRRPYKERGMTKLSWMLIVLGVVLWPLLVIALLLRVDVWRCPDCHRVLGRGRRPSLEW
jgi:two-component system, cell cycle sensor histidine kinase and response regulator CckA